MKKIPLLFAVLLSVVAASDVIATVDRTNVTDYGAVPNDGLDDTAAVNAAITAGTSIYFPPGTYNLTGQVTIPSNKSYRIYGDGPGVSVLSWKAGTGGGGFYDANAGIYQLNIEGLSITATQAMNNAAIRAIFTPGINLAFRTISIHDVEIAGSRPFGVAAYWTYGIHLTNAQNAVIDKVDITGGSATSGSPFLTTGIFWTGTTTNNTTGLLLTNAEIKFCKTGVQASGLVEGFYMSGFQVTFCGTATAPVIDLSTTSTPQGLAFHLVNGHVDAQYDGVHMTNLRGIHVHNVDFLRSNTTNPGTLLYLLNCKEATITDCTFLSDPNGAGSTENGIFLTSTMFTTISGNNFGDMQQGTTTGNCIVAYTGSTTVRVTNNIFHNVGSATSNSIGSQFYYDADNVVVP